MLLPLWRQGLPLWRRSPWDSRPLLSSSIGVTSRPLLVLSLSHVWILVATWSLPCRDCTWRYSLRTCDSTECSPISHVEILPHDLSSPRFYRALTDPSLLDSVGPVGPIGEGTTSLVSDLCSCVRFSPRSSIREDRATTHITSSLDHTA